MAGNESAAPPGPSGLDRSLLSGIALIRWVAWTWAAAGTLLTRENLTRPLVAACLLGLALAYTVWATVTIRTQHQRLLLPGVVATEVAVAVVLLVGDGLVFDSGRPQSLAWAWPSTAVMSAGVALGPRLGALAALVASVASFVGEGLVNGTRWGVAAGSTTGLHLLTGVAAGYVAQRLRDAERRISIARAREEVARTLHDGVLQTLAVVQRRSEDHELAQLARDQETELRAYLAGLTDSPSGLPALLRAAAARVERLHGLRVAVVVADDLPAVEPARSEAVAGAVGEALNNAGKHGRASRVTVYAEPALEGGIFVSIKDDGVGFETADHPEGRGIATSIRGRMADIGGRAEVAGRPGQGTEVRLWAP